MLNKVTLMGRLTRDPELRHTASNLPVCSFTLAVDRGFTKPGEKKQVDFIQIIGWRHTAEFCSKYFRKGMQVVVCGRIQTRNWEDDAGHRHYATEVIATETYFAGDKKDSSVDGDMPDGFEPVGSDDDLPF